jgi:hypothetical protein
MKSGAWTATQRPLPGGSAARGPTRLDPDDLTAAAADFLCYDLFTPLGLAADEARTATPSPGGTSIRTVGTVRFGWPRGAVLARAVHTISLVLLDAWISPDPKRTKGVTAEWAQTEWTRLGLGDDALTARLDEVAGRLAGGRIDDLFRAAVENLAPKGWLARLPDANRITGELARVTQLVGCPLPAANAVPTPVQDAFRAAVGKWGRTYQADLTRLVTGLLDNPAFRLAGTEDALRALLGLVNREATRLGQIQGESTHRARAEYDVLMQLVYYQKGMPKPTATAFQSAVKEYPTARYRSIQFRHLLDLYGQVKTTLSQLLAELSGLRVKLETTRTRLTAEGPPPTSPTGPRDLLPAKCGSVGEAVQRFIAALTDDDLSRIEQRVQAAVEAESGGVYSACVGSPDGVDRLVGHFRYQTRDYLDRRLGAADFAGMFAHRYATSAEATAAVTAAYDAATPRLVGPGPWSRQQVVVVACPPGPAGEPLRQIAAHALPADEPIHTTDLPDELTVYREYPAVPLTTLPQLGPTWEAAYKAFQDATQCSPHTRFDVAKWSDVNSG